jgi:ParB-like chromosome segregation protein Spo0J
MPRLASAIKRRPVAQLRPHPRNAGRYRPSQIEEIANSIREWGWTYRILIDESDEIIAGEGRWRTAQTIDISRRCFRRQSRPR